MLDCNTLLVVVLICSAKVIIPANVTHWYRLVVKMQTQKGKKLHRKMCSPCFSFLLGNSYIKFSGLLDVKMPLNVQSTLHKQASVFVPVDTANQLSFNFFFDCFLFMEWNMEYTWWRPNDQIPCDGWFSFSINTEYFRVCHIWYIVMLMHLS